MYVIFFLNVHTWSLKRFFFNSIEYDLLYVHTYFNGLIIIINLNKWKGIVSCFCTFYKNKYYKSC